MSVSYTRIPKYEEYEKVINCMELDEAIQFLKNHISQKKFIENYGERPGAINGDHITAYFNEYFESVPDLLGNLSQDLDIFPQFCDMICDKAMPYEN